ncbi:hypothetical protein, partial [Rhizobium sp. RHZ01]|uniref:hypothetical protein n=1 Tax=Rhizobium sp. RHZ01 TaxID=2769304 RepID=UPI001AED41C3
MAVSAALDADPNSSAQAVEHCEIARLYGALSSLLLFHFLIISLFGRLATISSSRPIFAIAAARS